MDCDLTWDWGWGCDQGATGSPKYPQVELGLKDPKKALEGVKLVSAGRGLDHHPSAAHGAPSGPAAQTREGHAQSRWASRWRPPLRPGAQLHTVGKDPEVGGVVTPHLPGRWVGGGGAGTAREPWKGH